MRRVTNVIVLCSLLASACGGGPAPNLDGTVQAAVRATVGAQNRAAAVPSPSALVAVSPRPSAAAASPSPASPSAVPTSPASTPVVAAPNPTPGIPLPSPSPGTAPIASPSARITVADSKLADQIRAVLERLPQPRTAVFQSLTSPVHVELDAQTEVVSASTIKLPVMISVYHEIALGHLSPTQRFTVSAADAVGGTGVLQGQVGHSLTTTELLETTLTYSDNTGGNMLLDALGGLEVVNTTMAEFGLAHTHVRRMLMDEAAQAQGLENTISAADLATMLTRIKHSDLISHAASAEMLRILELRGRQTDESLDYLGRYLVPRPTIAHLNGTLVHVRNDAGIVELADQPFILVALLHDQTNDSGAEEAIARAAADVTALVQGGANAH